MAKLRLVEVEDLRRDVGRRHGHGLQHARVGRDAPVGAKRLLDAVVIGIGHASAKARAPPHALERSTPESRDSIFCWWVVSASSSAVSGMSLPVSAVRKAR